MLFTMAVDKTVASKQGHTIEFKKGVPTHVPKECWSDVQAAGAVPEDQEAIAASQKVPGAPQLPEPDARAKAIHDAFEKIVAKNDRKSFTAAGVPTIPAMEALTGFDVDVRERDEAWVKFQQEE